MVTDSLVHQIEIGKCMQYAVLCTCALRSNDGLDVQHNVLWNIYINIISIVHPIGSMIMSIVYIL